MGSFLALPVMKKISVAQPRGSARRITISPKYLPVSQVCFWILLKGDGNYWSRSQSHLAFECMASSHVHLIKQRLERIAGDTPARGTH